MKQLSHALRRLIFLIAGGLLLFLGLGGITSVQAGTLRIFESFDYPLGFLDKAKVAGLGLERAWVNNPRRLRGATLRIATLTWQVPPGYGLKVPTKGLGASIPGQAAVLLRRPIDFETPGEVWFSFLFRRSLEAEFSLCTFSLHNGKEDIAVLWQTLPDGGVTAWMGQREQNQSAGFFYPELGQDVLVVGHLQTDFLGPDSLVLQITPANKSLPRSFTGQLFVDTMVHGIANWMRWEILESTPPAEIFFGNVVWGSSYEEVVGLLTPKPLLLFTPVLD